MNKHRLLIWFFIFGSNFSLSAQVIAEEISDLSVLKEYQEQLIISPKTQIVLEPNEMTTYVSEVGVSIRTGTSIQPGKNGWFRATVKEPFKSFHEASKIADHIRAFPNPVESGKLTVDIPEEQAILQLWDLNGRLMTIPLVTTDKLQRELDMSSLNPGIYLLQIKVGKSTHQQKILKR